MWVFFFLVASCVCGQGTFDTSKYPESLKCFDDPIERGELTLKLQYHGWDSHSVVRWLVAILLRESLGYNVEFVDSSRVATVQTFESIARGAVDIDAEVWAASKRSAYDQFITSLGLVQDLGELGTAGLERLYISSELTQDDDPHPPEYYRSYENTTRPFRVLPSSYFSAVGAPLECTDARGSFSPTCERHTPGRYACRQDNFPLWECQRGIWYSDSCCNATAKDCAADLGALDKCVEIWYPDPGWTTGIFEQSLQNLKIPVSFVYLGDPKTYQAMVEEALLDTSQPPPLWYWFEPDPWFNRLEKIAKFELFVLPPWTDDCFETVVSTPNGNINCDSQVDFVKKIARSDLETEFPNAFHFLKQLQVRKADYNFMFDVLNSNAEGNHFQAACALAREMRFNRSEQFSAMIQPSLEDSLSTANPIAAALVVFALLGLCSSVALAGVFVKFRNSKTIVRRSGVYYMTLQVMGLSFISLGSVISFIELSVAACAAKDWLLLLGYTLTFATLFSKNWRIYRLFQASQNLKKASITNKDLIPLVGALVGVTFVLMCIMEGMRAQKLKRDRAPDNFAVTNVTCQHMSNPGEILLAIYIILLTVWGLYLAVRNINLQGEFNESRSTALAVYTLAICMVVILLFNTLLHNDPLNLVLVLAGIEAFAAWAILVILFAPALWYLWKEYHTVPDQTRMDTTDVSGNPPSTVRPNCSAMPAPSQLTELQTRVTDVDLGL